MDDHKVETVQVKICVSDKAVELIIDGSSLDTDAITDAARHAVSVGATRFEVRTLTLTIPLLAPITPEVQDGSSVPTQVEMPTEIVERLRREHGMQEAERLMSVLMQTLAPGTYEVTRDGSSRGIRKIG